MWRKIIIDGIEHDPNTWTVTRNDDTITIDSPDGVVWQFDSANETREDRRQLISDAIGCLAYDFTLPTSG